jgi:hypothetical protein
MIERKTEAHLIRQTSSRVGRLLHQETFLRFLKEVEQVNWIASFISHSLEAALSRIQMIVKQVSRYKFAATRAFHLNTVLNHFLNVFNG